MQVYILKFLPICVEAGTRCEQSTICVIQPCRVIHVACLH